MKKLFERTSRPENNRHKRIFKIAALLLSALSILTALSACGSNVPSEMTASEAFKKGSIWFYGNAHDGAIAKDEYVNDVLVFQDGKVTCYPLDARIYGGNTEHTSTLKPTRLSYGDLNGLSDKEILAKVKENDKENFDINKKGAIAECEDNIAFHEDAVSKVKLSGRTPSLEWMESENQLIKFYKKRIRELKKLTYQEPKPVSYKLSIKTDDSGNNAVSEKIEITLKCLNGRYLDHNCDTADNTPYKSENKTLFLEPGIGTQTIYDTKFSGYDNMFTIVKNENTTFTLDNRKSKGVEVE